MRFVVGGNIFFLILSLFEKKSASRFGGAALNDLTATLKRFKIVNSHLLFKIRRRTPSTESEEEEKSY